VWWAWKTPGWADFWKVFKMSPFFRFFLISFFHILVSLGKMRPEVLTFLEFMWYCRSVVIGAKQNLFTPMYLFVCRKPVAVGGAEKEEGRGYLD
jgi:hypothetical protein